jgi:hypothetical protein
VRGGEGLGRPLVQVRLPCLAHAPLVHWPLPAHPLTLTDTHSMVDVTCVRSDAGQVVGGKIDWGHLAGADAKLYVGDFKGGCLDCLLRPAA